jgi:hypothetical protein
MLTVGATLCVLTAVAGCGDRGGDSAKGQGRPARLASHNVATRTHGKSPQESWAGPSDDYTPTGPLVADDGFRPRQDGFSFPNYDGQSGAVNLTPAAMEELFGPDVCSSGVGSSCLLTPVAQQWLAQLNSNLQGGHCYGFSVSVLRFYAHALSPSVFGAPTVPALTIQGNDLLQTEIAEAFITQAFPSVRAKVIGGPPRHILGALVTALKKRRDYYTLGFYKQDGSGGHAITPYAVEQRGGGKFAALVYDNNHPGKTRAFMFDREANSWTYDAAISPSYEESHYQGGAQDHTLELHPMSPGLGPQPCPFCGSENQSGDQHAKGSGRPPTRTQQIALEGDPSNHGHLLITDSRGRRTGYVGNKLVKEIPGSRAAFPLMDQNWRVHPEPLYTLPAGAHVKISVSGGGLARASVGNVSVVRPGRSAAVDGIRVGPGQRAQLSFGRRLATVSYRPGNVVGAAPIVKLGREADKADFAATLKAPVLHGDEPLEIKLDLESKAVTVKTPAGAPVHGYSLTLSRLTGVGKQGFAHGDLSIAPDSKSRLDFGGFNRDGESLPFSVQSDGGRRSTTLSG